MVSHVHPIRSPGLLGHGLLLMAILTGGTACTSTPQVRQAVYSDPQVTVFLQAVPDTSFHADHPANLDSASIAMVLDGIRILARQRTLQTMVAGPPTSVRAFTTQEIRFLAPHLIRALSTAAPNQTIGFQLVHPQPESVATAAHSQDQTAGTLYAQGNLLYISLSEYGGNPARSGDRTFDHRRLPDHTGLADRRVVFTPDDVLRTDSVRLPTTIPVGSQTLAIDLAALTEASRSRPPTAVEQPPQSLREESAMVLSPAQSSEVEKALALPEQEIRTLKDLIVQKDLEIERLRTELRSMKERLDGRLPGPDQRKRDSP